ncbi:DUF6157 family protein [Pedobacter aquatilis]|uniref:DUF6157 family protein n=1 Tax=Pedobacter aquatilis TaxID=351343 RepID=UPI0029309793|nr:DUF6157 family protein [Pedobacter aquatilis]
MKQYSTNYQDTFIKVAEDSPAIKGESPPMKGENKTVASMQFELISAHPYRYTSDDVLFQVYADRNDLLPQDYDEARKIFFSKGQACLRASPLTKRYGWGIHHDKTGKIALYGLESPEYEKLANDQSIKHVNAMRSTR